MASYERRMMNIKLRWRRLALTKETQDYTPTLPFTVSQSYGVMNKALVRGIFLGYLPRY